MTLDTLKNYYKKHKEQLLFGRYINTEHIKPLLEKHATFFKIDEIGQSVLGENIHSITLGNGPKKILMWSQMHGNESTTTKAIFDLLNTIKVENKFSKQLLKSCTVKIIPILNPDGAKMYTRLNANTVDLNRDAQKQSQPESKVLKDCFENFKPHYCFNLHGQRTIFNVGNTNKSATVSFLSPAQDEACSVTETRKKAMSVIVKMNTVLQLQIPGQVGTYDDAFNINCVGDTFQTLNTPTVLFEAGHYANDYDREVVREFIYQSLITALNTIINDEVDVDDYKDYLRIPENKKYYYDIIIRNALVNNEMKDIAVQYEEKLDGNTLDFVPRIVKMEPLKDYHAHKTIEAYGTMVLGEENEALKLGSEIDFVKVNNVKLSLKILKS